MSGESTDRVHNGIPYTNHQTAVMNGNQDPNKDLSKSPSCLADGDSYNPESVMALRNAYSILRDRYNKLKLEHQKLQKQLQKVIVPSSKQKSQISNSKAELNNSLKELAGPHISGDEPLSTGTLISELEQLRERLDKLSREALSHVDTHLKGMMENVIPKLRELERQCSSLSEEDPRSLILFCSRKTQVKSICDEKFISQKTSEDIPGKQESIFHTPNQSLSEDFLPSSDLSDSSLYQSNMDLVNDLLLTNSSVSSQTNDLKHIYDILKQQNESLKKIDGKPVNRQLIPKPGIANSPPDSEWSLIPNY